MLSKEINEIAAAICKMQAVLESASKDKANPFFKSKYADLTAIWDICREPLTDNGLSVVQTCRMIEEVTYLTTTLLHTSGQWIDSVYPINPVKQDPQAYGSALTYARRYMLSAILGITSEDDDGNAASEPKPKPKPVDYKKSAEEFTAMAINEIDACTTANELNAFSERKDGKGKLYGDKVNWIQDKYPTLGKKITEANNAKYEQLTKDI